MRNLIKSAVLVILIYSLGFGQPRMDEARLLGTFGPNDSDVLNLLYKLGLALKPIFDSKEDYFVVRVCSNEPMPVALALGSGAPFLTTLRLEKIGISKSRIFYLRQNRGCKISPNNTAVTDYWFIPKGAEFPDFLEARRASNLAGYQLTHADNLEKGDRAEVGEVEHLTPQSYRIVLDEVIKLLANNKSAVAIIQVPYYRRSITDELNKRVIETQRHLKANGIANYRLYIRKIYQGATIPHGIDTPKYPDIFVVSEN